jgi:hypothetical protein
VLSEEATQNNVIVFGLTRPGLEPMIYHTRDKHPNHYTTDAVRLIEIVDYVDSDSACYYDLTTNKQVLRFTKNTQNNKTIAMHAAILLRHDIYIV